MSEPLGNPLHKEEAIAVTLEILGVHESLHLLRSATIGRLVFTENALPAIRPVNFTMSTAQIIVRGERGSWVDKLDRMVVAFEADHVEPATHTGWSVVVVGKAHKLTDLDDLAEPGLWAPHPWPAGTQDQHLAIDMEHITGRRLSLPGHHLNGDSAAGPR
jgi:uncharacterized protein